MSHKIGTGQFHRPRHAYLCSYLLRYFKRIMDYCHFLSFWWTRVFAFSFCYKCLQHMPIPFIISFLINGAHESDQNFFLKVITLVHKDWDCLDYIQPTDMTSRFMHQMKVLSLLYTPESKTVYDIPIKTWKHINHTINRFKSSLTTQK